MCPHRPAWAPAQSWAVRHFRLVGSLSPSVPSRPPLSLIWHRADEAADFSEYGEDADAQGVTKVLALVTNAHAPLTSHTLSYVTELTMHWSPRQLGLVLRELHGLLQQHPAWAGVWNGAQSLVAVLRAHRAKEGERWPFFVAEALRDFSFSTTMTCLNIMYAAEADGASLVAAVTKSMSWVEVMHACLGCTSSLAAAHNFIRHTGRALTPARALSLVTFLFTSVWERDFADGRRDVARLGQALRACFAAGILGTSRLEASRDHGQRRVARQISQAWPRVAQAAFLAVAGVPVEGRSGSSSEGSDSER